MMPSTLSAGSRSVSRALAWGMVELFLLSASVLTAPATAAAQEPGPAATAAPPYALWAILAVGVLLLLGALYATFRRLRAEKRLDILARLTADLERRDAILRAVAGAGTRFLDGEDLDHQLGEAIEQLGSATPADRGRLLRVDPVAEAAATDAAADSDPLRRAWRDAPEADGWRRALAEGRVLDLPAPDRPLPEGFPPSASLLLVPVFADGTLRGALAFPSTGPVHWSEAEIDALRTAAAIVGAAISRGAARAALREREEQLRQAQKLEAIGRLAGGIAHDFNNLLTSVGGNAALLAETDSLGAEERTLVQEITDSVERGSDLARQLLAFGRRQAHPSVTVDAAAVVRNMRHVLDRILGEAVRLDIRAEPGAWVSLPPGHIDQIVMNVAVNARDAMPGGGSVEILVHSREAADGPERVIEVVDTGAGMDGETLARVLDPFFSTKDSGSGLGLSIVYGLATQAGGSVDVDSEPGRGTRVTLRLPAAAAPEPGSEDASPVAGAAAPPTAGADDDPGTEDAAAPHGKAERNGSPAGATILLVEDEPAVRLLARRVLDRAGYRVVEAEDGRQGLAMLDALDRPVHLLLTDVRMPNMSGADLAEAAAERGCDCPVLFMSGYAAEDLELGRVDPDRYLEKPFTPGQLLDRVSQALGTHAPGDPD